jgi:hypothetical protein
MRNQNITSEGGKYGKGICGICGREICWANAMRYKTMVRHLCKHGRTCIRGTRRATGNHTQNCVDCFNDDRLMHGLEPISPELFDRVHRRAPDRF